MSYGLRQSAGRALRRPLASCRLAGRALAWRRGLRQSALRRPLASRRLAGQASAWRRGLLRTLRRLAPLCLLALAGCVSSRVEQSRLAPTVMTGDETLVLLGRASYNDRQAEASFTDCLADVLARGRDPIRLMHPDDFKDRLYPWFEPRLEPTTTDQLAELLAEPGVRARIDAAKVRYIAWIEGDTITVDKGGSMSCTVSTFGGGCFGMSYWEEDASYLASIWDLETMTSTGQIRADATGTSYLAGIIIPIPILARPGNAACKGLAKQLGEFMRGG